MTTKKSIFINEAGYALSASTTTTDTSLNTGSTNPVQNQAIATVLNQILDVIAVAPTYSAPSVSITNVSQTVEMGTTLSSFAVNISFNQNDAGSAQSYELCRNSVQYSTDQNNTLSESNITSNISYVGKVTYACGITKDNNLGIPDPTGKILSGTTASAARTIVPRLKQFWGNTSAVPEDSAAVRALNSNNYSTVNNFELVTGTVNKVFAVAIPNTKSISNVYDVSTFANLTSCYALINGSFTVKDAGNNDQTYKLYAMSQAIPNPQTTNHCITLS